MQETNADIVSFLSCHLAVFRIFMHANCLYQCDFLLTVRYRLKRVLSVCLLGGTTLNNCFSAPPRSDTCKLWLELSAKIFPEESNIMESDI